MDRVRLAFAAILSLGFLPLAHSATVVYDFNVTWVTANPDGAFDRPAIGINGKWPIPRLEANVGDRVVINVNNQLETQSTSLHFHGLFMNGSSHMDGPSQVTQCPILPGNSFTYDFTVNQPGSYWYHSHTKGQYPDGLRGPFIVHDPESPYAGHYDEEVVMTLSDWYHDQMSSLIPTFMSKTNPTGAEPVPDAALINETQDLSLAVQPGKTYLFRMVNMGAFASQYVWFEGHNMTIVEVDGVYTKPRTTEMIYLSVGQRCSFLITMRDDTASNFAFVGSMDITLFDVLPSDLQWNVTGWLEYDAEKPHNPPETKYEFDPIDDLDLVPFDELPRLPEPGRTVSLDVIMDNLGDGANYAFFNNITYVEPKVPTLYTALGAGDLAMDSRIYGEYTHPFVLEKNDVVQIVLNNMDDGRHPFHLHGHNFQALYRSPEYEDPEDRPPFDVPDEDLPEIPMRRDTIVVWPNGNVILRFRADNPGVWLFHCHIEWHVTSGLVATFVEAPLELQQTLDVPSNHIDACSAGNIPTRGNAAGNDKDLLNLKGQNRPPNPLPAGFTTGGIIAFIISCITGIVGVSVVAWYGMHPVEKKRKSRADEGTRLLDHDAQSVTSEGSDSRHGTNL